MTPGLNDDVVLLRRYRAEDAQAMYEAARESIADVGRWLPWCHADYCLADASEWIATSAAAWEARAEYRLGIFEQGSGRFVGGAGLNFIDWLALRANLGYWVRTSATGRGYATRAARLLAHYAVHSLGLERLEIIAAIGNTRSQRVAAKAGATREGIARCRIRIAGEQHDAVVFSLVRQDLILG